MKKEAIRVVTTVPAAPTTLYYAWLASEQHSAMTGSAAKIDPTVGAKYSAANGFVTGKLVILDLGRRLVMSWRTTDFPREAPDSKVEMHLEAIGASTRITLLHTELPEGHGEKARAHWNDAYFTPMRNFFSKFLPDPRNPPPPRRPPPPPDDEEEDVEETPPKKAIASKKPQAPIKIPAKPTPPAKPAPPAKPEKPEKAEKKAEKKAAKPAPAPAPAPAKPAKKAAKPAPKKAAPKPKAKAAPKKAAPKPKAKAKPKQKKK